MNNAIKPRLLSVGIGLAILAGFGRQALGYEKIITKPHYIQQEDHWCGAATAQMILESEVAVTRLSGYPTGTTTQIQDTLYSTIQSNNNTSTPQNWYSDPDGLEGCLDTYDPGGIYTQYLYPDAATACKKLAYTIEAYTVPPAVLINEGAHWVAVSGVRSSATPTYDSTAYEIYGFYVNDPLNNSGTLGFDKYIGYTNWTTCYFTQVDSASGDPWDNLRVSVCDPQPVQPGLIEPPPREGQQLMTPQEAMAAAENQIREHGLLYTDGFEQALGGASPAHPLEVFWLCDKNCYVVPFCQTEGIVSALVTIDAYRDDGRMMEATYTTEQVPIDRFYGGLTYPFVTFESSARPDGVVPVVRIVPEPAAVTLLAVGGLTIVGLGLMRHRRRNRQATSHVSFCGTPEFPGGGERR